jgi:hypothetical protein
MEIAALVVFFKLQKLEFDLGQLRQKAYRDVG